MLLVELSDDRPSIPSSWYLDFCMMADDRDASCGRDKRLHRFGHSQSHINSVHLLTTVERGNKDLFQVSHIGDFEYRQIHWFPSVHTQPRPTRLPQAYSNQQKDHSAPVSADPQHT